MPFTLPSQTPPGHYLLRFDLVSPGGSGTSIGDKAAQLYPSCAQIEVKSEANGDLPKGVLIPEIFQNYAPGKNGERGLWLERMTYATSAMHANPSAPRHEYIV